MKLKNILIVVEDIEKAKEFYRDLFGLDVLMDFDGNVILTEGLVLQDKNIWERLIGRQSSKGVHDAELYFEENDIDAFLEKLERSKYDIDYINKCAEQDWGQRVIRLYDLDKHVIEIRESMEFAARRFLNSGMSAEETAKKTQLPLSQIMNMQRDEY